MVFLNVKVQDLKRRAFEELKTQVEFKSSNITKLQYLLIVFKVLFSVKVSLFAPHLVISNQVKFFVLSSKSSCFEMLVIILWHI